MPGIYVIADVHGCYKTLDYLLEQVLKPTVNDQLIFLGDYINKGPDSKGVLDRIIHLRETGFKVSCVRGNHDQLFLDARNGAKEFDSFINNGGKLTMESFGERDIKQIPDKYFKFIDEMPYYLEMDDFFIVHGGFNCQLANPFEDLNAMLTIRNFQYDSYKLKNKIVIHGHNAISLNLILESLIDRKGFIYNIDNGCVYNKREEMGHLICLNLVDFSFHIQPNLDL